MVREITEEFIICKTKANSIIKIAETMGMVVNSVTYFDDHGNKESTEVDIDMNMGGSAKVSNKQMSLKKDGYTYIIDMSSKTGTKTKISEIDEKNDIDFSNLTEDIMKQFKITKQGSEDILGKNCQKYSLEDPSLKMKVNYSVWNGIPLRIESSMMGSTIIITAAKIEENCVIPAEKFEIPKDVIITEKSSK